MRKDVAFYTTMVFAAFMALFIAYVSLQRLTDPRAPFDTVAAAHPAVYISFRAIIFAMNIAMLGIAAAALPLLISIIKNTIIIARMNVFALLRVNRRAVIYAAIGAIGFTLMFYAYLFAGGLLTGNYFFLYDPHAVFTPQFPLWVAITGEIVLFAVLAILTWLTLLGILMIGSVLQRSDIGRRAYLLALAAGSFVILGLVAAVAGNIVWGINILTDAPAFFASNNGLSGGSPWLATVGLMAAAAITGIFYYVRGIALLRRKNISFYENNPNILNL